MRVCERKQKVCPHLETLRGRVPPAQRLHAGRETGTSISTTHFRTFPEHTCDARLRRLQADRPMTPQASLAPALPVVLLVLPCVPISLLSPLPRSSSCGPPASPHEKCTGSTLAQGGRKGRRARRACGRRCRARRRGAPARGTRPRGRRWSSARRSRRLSLPRATPDTAEACF